MMRAFILAPIKIFNLAVPGHSRRLELYEHGYENKQEMVMVAGV